MLQPTLPNNTVWSKAVEAPSLFHLFAQPPTYGFTTALYQRPRHHGQMQCSTCRLHISLSVPCGVGTTFGSGPFGNHITTLSSRVGGKARQFWPVVIFGPYTCPALCLLGTLNRMGTTNTGHIGGPQDFDFFVVFLWIWSPGPFMKHVVCY